MRPNGHARANLVAHPRCIEPGQLRGAGIVLERCFKARPSPSGDAGPNDLAAHRDQGVGTVAGTDLIAGGFDRLFAQVVLIAKWKMAEEVRDASDAETTKRIGAPWADTLEVGDVRDECEGTVRHESSSGVGSRPGQRRAQANDIMPVVGRLPFDPDQAVGPADASPTTRPEDRPEALSVGELAEHIRVALERGIEAPVRVVGEISNLKTPGHWYFSMKDDDAVISCVAWASSTRRFGFTPGDGDEVLATGHVSHYAPQGRTQFYVSSMQPVGAGALERRFRELCDALRARGYFAEDAKVPLPLVPRRVAVITSRHGAAVQDVITTAAQRCPAVGLVIIDVRVQGDEAAGEVAAAIRWVDGNAERLGVDAMIVTRGGGSIEDLWSFNQEAVADAAFACRLPIVAAIGHESDTTIIELVADCRASTPTQAAMLLIPSSDELRQQIDHGAHRLVTLLRARLDRARIRLERCQTHPLLRDPTAVLERERERLAARESVLRRAHEGRLFEARSRLERLVTRLARGPGQALLSERRARLTGLTERLRRASARSLPDRAVVGGARERLSRASQRRVSESRAQLRAVQQRLDAVDPHNVLARGYSMTWDDQGALIRSVSQASPGERLTTRLSDGEVRSTVDGADRPPPARRTTRSRRRSIEADQMDLFESTE